MKGKLLFIACLIPCLDATCVAETLSGAQREDLLRKAADWEVPQPSDKARLIKVWAYESDTDKFVLAFVEPDQPGQAMAGLETVDLAKGVETRKAGEPIDFSDVTCTSPFGSHQGTNMGLVTGVQLLRQGNLKEGETLIGKALGEEAGHPRSPFHIPAGKDPVLMLARSCLADVMNDVTAPKPDFPLLLRRMQRLLADRPDLRSKSTDWAVEALQASANHPASAAGSIEDIIDRYLLSGGIHGVFATEDEMLPAERELVLKGFEAVPAVIAQLDSKRLTNHLMQGINNFPSHPMTAGSVLHDYLQRLANDEFGSNWLEGQKGISPEKSAIDGWWEEARRSGEREHVVRHLLRPDPRSDQNGSMKMSEELLLIASDRYPDCLPGIYRRLLESSTPSDSVAKAIASNKAIPPEAKLDLFSDAASRDRSEGRNSALAQLLALERLRGEARLIALLDRCARTPKGEYWLDPDAELGHFVSKSTTPAVWEAFHRAVGRGDLGMKMELVDHLSPPRDAPPEIRASFFKVYDRFGNDTTVRDTSASPKFDGPGAGFPYDRIRWMDFVHLHFARWLELAVDTPDGDASAKEWDAYRAQVKPLIEAARPQ